MGLKQSRKISAAVMQKNEELVTAIKEIKAEHPFWGYRRVCANLRYRNGFMVNQKRIYRLMKINHLLVAPNLKLIAKRTSNTRKPCPARPNEWWGIDMTKVLLSNVGWLYVVFVLDRHTKKIVGHYAGIQSKAEHWLEAFNK